MATNVIKQLITGNLIGEVDNERT